jgi:hypothetical protein
LGFVAPTAHQEEGAHGPPGRSRKGTPGFARDCASGSHPASYGAAHRFSQPRSGSCLPPPSCHFQAGGAPGVPPFRGLFHPRRPDGSSPPACPPDVPPVGWPSPVLGGGASGRTGCSLGSAASTFDRLQGLHPRGSRSCHRSTVSVPVTDLPLLGFRLLMGCAPACGWGFRPNDRRASRAGGPSPDRQGAALHGLPLTGVGPLSRDDPPITRFFAFDCLFRCGGARRGLIRLRLIRLCPSRPSRGCTDILASLRLQTGVG